MSLVDVSGQNRTCLPSTPYHEGGEYLGPPWKVGFSETAGHRDRYVSSLKWERTAQPYQTLIPRKFIHIFVVSNWVLKDRIYENEVFNAYLVCT
jgi:hypothetical protein